MFVHISMSPEEIMGLQLRDLPEPENIVRRGDSPELVEYISENPNSGDVFAEYEYYVVDVSPAGPSNGEMEELRRWKNDHLNGLKCKKILLRTEDISVEKDFASEISIARLVLRYSKVDL